MIGGLIAGGANLLGGLLTNEANANMTRETNQQNYQMAQEQMQFQKYMSNTAYQRATNDMRAAGLNPVLAYSQGGASTPSGSGISASMGPRSENALGGAVASALEARRLKKELEATDSQVSLNNAISATQNAQTKLNENNAKVAEKNAKIIDAQLPAIKQKAILDQKRDAIDAKMVAPDAIMNRVGQATGIIGNATGIMKPKIQVSPTGGWNPPPGTTLMDSKTGEVLREGIRRR